MAKIIDPDSLNLGSELKIFTSSYTIQLFVSGNLSNDGVTLQTVYSKLKELWKSDASFIPHPFPIVAITEESMEVGDTWNWADQTTKNLIRDGGWALKSGSTSNEEYMNVTTLGSFVTSSDRAYYLQAAAGAPTQSAVFSGPMNEPVKIYGNTEYGGFNYRSYFYIYLREYAKTYGSYDLLTEQNLTALTYKKYAMPLSNATDIKITHNDGSVNTGSAYTGINITYYTGSVSRTIGAGTYQFNKIIYASGSTAEQIYEKVQYQLRRYSDIDAGAQYSSITGSVATELLSFIGDTLRTKVGVYIDSFSAIDTNRLEFTDTGSTVRTFPYVAAGNLLFNDNLKNDANAIYRMFFTSVPSGSYGSPTAMLVQDNSNLPITGSVGGASSVAFTFDYDNNSQGGRTKAQDAPVTIVAIGLSSAQYVKTTSTIGRSTANNISMVSSLERNYSNP